MARPTRRFQNGHSHRDEPFASIDAQTRMSLQQDLMQVWELRHPIILFFAPDIEKAVFLSSHIVVRSSRLSQVREIVEVDVPRPRSWDDLVEDADFRNLVHRIVGLLANKPAKGGGYAAQAA